MKVWVKVFLSLEPQDKFKIKWWIKLKKCVLKEDTYRKLLTHTLFSSCQLLSRDDDAYFHLAFKLIPL